MKSIISKIKLVLSLLLIVIVSSCDDDNEIDVVKPVINLIEPENEDILLTGEEVHFEMELSDDIMLGSYKVEIHNNFNGHDHSNFNNHNLYILNQSNQITRSESERDPFAYNRSWDLSGKKNVHIHHHEIVIPKDAATGEYHLIVYCTDAAGNESYVVRHIVIDDAD